MPPPPHVAVPASRVLDLDEPDPMLAALLAAPVADELETDEERAAFDAIEADIPASPSCGRSPPGCARAPFEAMAALPEGTRPVNGWSDRAEAWTQVVDAIVATLPRPSGP